jgi:hypothetical protein
MKAAALLLSAGLFCAARAGDGPLTCSVTPRVIEVGSFYNGAPMRIEGRAGAGSKVVIAIAGPEAEERFKTKNRFGPVWLTAGKVGVSGVPSLFLRFSPEPVRNLLPRDTMESHNLDEASIMRRMRIDSRAGSGYDAASLRAEFVSLKKAEKIYDFGNSGVVVSGSGDGVSYRLDFRWPRSAPPARYEVRAYEVRGGAVIGEAESAIQVVRTGFPSWLSGMAENRPALYGITAILIAALAGFGIDFVTTHLFGGKRETAH